MKTFWETENRYKYNAACWGFGPLGEEHLCSPPARGGEHLKTCGSPRHDLLGVSSPSIRRTKSVRQLALGHKLLGRTNMQAGVEVNSSGEISHLHLESGVGFYYPFTSECVLGHPRRRRYTLSLLRLNTT